MIIKNRKAPKEPMIKDIEKKYPLLFNSIEELLNDKNLFKDVKYYIKHLEWCSLFYGLIQKQSKKELTLSELYRKYSTFHEEIVKKSFELSPYLKSEIYLPSPTAHVYNKLENLLRDDTDVLDLIKERYPYQRKRMNKRELHNKAIDKMLNISKNVKHHIRYLPFIHIKGVENKEFIFKNVIEDTIEDCLDNNGNPYIKIEKIHIVTLDTNIVLKKDIDYTICLWGSIHLINLHNSKDIKVTISTNNEKFKRI